MPASTQTAFCKCNFKSRVLNHITPRPHAFIFLFLTFVLKSVLLCLRASGSSLVIALLSCSSPSLVPPRLLPALVRLIQASTALPTAAHRSTERQGSGRREGGRTQLEAVSCVLTRPALGFHDDGRDRRRQMEELRCQASLTGLFSHRDRQEQCISEARWLKYLKHFLYYDK